MNTPALDILQMRKTAEGAAPMDAWGKVNTIAGVMGATQPIWAKALEPHQPKEPRQPRQHGGIAPMGAM